MAPRTIGSIGDRRSGTSSPFRFKTLGPLFALVVASFIFNAHELFDLQFFFNTISGSYDESFNAPVVESGHPHVYKWEELKKEHLPDHGTFFFGPTSHQIKIPKNATYEPYSDWTDEQRALLDDEKIDPNYEKQRCASYNFGYTNRTKRRRLFLGALLADDSFEVLKAVSTEVYNIYHTVSFVESNVTHNLSPRKMRFYDPDRPSANLYQLYQMYGPNTKVSVDYYSSHMKEGHDLLRDFIQREGNSFRWALNGMKRDDVAIVSDTDETFTRDFLRALQICDIPQFRPGQDCNDPGIRASTLVFESTPECLTKHRRWYHPDAMLGECVDQIGDINLHPRGKREWPPADRVKNHTVYHGYRLEGYGGSGDYSKYHAENKFDSGHVPYPLYYATDQRMEGGHQIQRRDSAATGYHFHNFFESEKEIHHKYLTYGHAWWEADKKPIWELHEDIALGVDCSRGKYEKATNFAGIQSSLMPIYYINEINRIARHSKWQKVVHDEENWWNVQNEKKKIDTAQNIVVIEEDGAVEKAKVVDVVTKPEEGNDDKSGSSPHPHVYKWEDLKQRHQRAHGTFFFGPHSHQIEIPEDSKYEPQLTDEQRALLDDEEIDPEKERQRCASYNFDYDGRKERRRLFLGTLLADDSMDILKAVGMEMYNIFHTVSFVESNVTHNLSPRSMRFYDPERPSSNLYQLYQYFGPKTKVSVDYYSNHMRGGYDLLRDFIQREGNSFRWAFNGMRPDDVAVVGDTDETFTRDFLRALQICDIRQFKPGQDCRDPKLRASTFVFESTPECLTKNRRWYHPDAILGECVDQIGDINLHPPTKRDWPKPHDVKNDTVYHGWRLPGYGRGNDYSKYLAENKFESGHVPYPLYYATDVRMEPGVMIQKQDGSPTGYHFHNFFTSEQEIHHKYLTYGHAWNQADKMPIWKLHEDLALGVDCANGKYDKGMEFAQIQGTSVPIYFKNPDNRKARHEQWQKIVKNEETWWEEKTNPKKSPAEENNNKGVGAASVWKSSKSVVLGLATNYGFNIYEQFVGSLRATGYTGHIILGISKDAPSDVLQYLKEQNVTGHVVEPAEKCTYNGTLGNDGNILDMHTSHEWNCPKAYPDYKITWARFLLYRDWLKKCPSCTDGVMLTDVRDSIFQSDPFVAAVELKQQAPLMLFEEHPHMKNTHWLTDIPVSSCRKHKVGGTQVLCSGSVMGSREGILDYIDVMASEFHYWKTRSECRIDMRGDDQSIHNYLYYTNRFKNAVSIPHRTGPIHIIGYQAARISEKVELEGRTAEMDEWQTWLPEKYGLIDPKTGYILNMDGRASPQVHQIDRFEHLLGNWRHKMIHEFKWSYSRKEMFCTREGSHALPNMSHEIPMKEDMVIDFEEVRNFSNAPLEKVRHFTIEDYEKYMMAPAGKEHYALLNYLSQTYGDCRHVTDIGTRYVSSALAMASNLRTPVWTFDLPTSTERVEAFRGKTEDEWQTQLHQVGANVTFFNVDLLKVSDEDFKTYLGTWFVMLDTHHRPYTVPFEREFFKRILDIGFKGLLLLDDINEHDEMRRWWKEVQDGATEGGYKTYVLSPIGHWSGTGLVDFSGKVIIKE